MDMKLLPMLFFLGSAAAFAQESPLRPACQAKLPEVAGEGRGIAGLDGWWYSKGEIPHLIAGKFWGPEAALVSQATRPDAKDPLPAILDFKAQCDKAGVKLLLVPIPPKAVIYPEGLDAALKPGGGGKLDPFHHAFYTLLAKEGVSVLDVTEAFIAARDSTPVYCKTDSHFSPAGARLVARLVSDALAPSLDGLPSHRASFTEREDTLQIKGDLDAPESESLPIWFVKQNVDGAEVPVEPARESPVVLMGDSHTLVFEDGGSMHAVSAGLLAHLSRDLGFPLDRVGTQGSGTSAPRITLLKRKDNLAGKKAIVWVFTARDFTANTDGWRLIPVIR